MPELIRDIPNHQCCFSAPTAGSLCRGCRRRIFRPPFQLRRRRWHISGPYCRPSEVRWQTPFWNRFRAPMADNFVARRRYRHLLGRKFDGVVCVMVVMWAHNKLQRRRRREEDEGAGRRRRRRCGNWPPFLGGGI